MIEQLKTGFFLNHKKEAELFLDCGGRFEVLGNHTDHNHGLCIAGTCSLKINAAVSKRNDLEVHFVSKGFNPFVINLKDLEKKEEEKETSEGLIRGIARYLKDNSYNIGGFDVYMESTVPAGAGVSSSAAFELLVGQIFNVLFNEGKIEKLVLCKAGHFAERNFFGKKCGLLDQIGVAYGGYTSIDFKDEANPVIESLKIDMAGYHFVIVNSGGSHADLSDLYSQIPADMLDAAHEMGHNFLREGTKEELLKHKGSLSSRAYDRAMHFYNENERVVRAKEYIKNGNIQGLIDMMNASRISSTELLKNMYVNKIEGSPVEACNLVLEASEGKAGVKINGGGFAGSVISLVPDAYLDKVTNKAKERYGEHNVHIIDIRNTGPDFLKD